ncbi:MAG: RNA degradosome polyphosphate kinase [Eubacteriales bacterium]|nr:RNA degradosome polyphosphate kinase [Eubacteriales bacterium]
MGRETGIDLNDSNYYRNRELSWLDFNERILEEARDRGNLLFERLKFLSITSSNLDEFFMVRVASIKDMIHAGYEKPDISGMSAEEQLTAIQKKTHEMVAMQYSTYQRSLLKDLKEAGLKVIASLDELNKNEADYLDKYFTENVYPVLTPMAYDSSRPFPLVVNKTLNIAALVRPKKSGKHAEGPDFAMVQVPSVLSRIVELPPRVEEDGRELRPVILLERVIEKHIDKLFSNYDVLCTAPFRIMRNADFSLDEDEAEDLLEEIKKQLKKRRWGEVIRLEIDEKADKKLIRILKEELEVTNEDIYYIGGPLDLTFLMKMYGLSGFDALKDAKYTPQPVPELMNEDGIFDNIRSRDIFLHHPYETFEPVVDFVRTAARDPQVLAIKQTLYRVSSTSPIIAALEEAAGNGKQVTVLVELKARFDEENNILWAKRLEKAGCHVIYGLLGLKTHSKITLVVRREEDGIRRYVHLGTGNYNDSTAKLYTDCGIFTADPRIGEDATAVFNMLSGYSEPAGWNELLCAPLWLRKWLLAKIRKEAENAAAGRPSGIVAKMNALCDKEVIAALYDASQKGVKIDLIIRGICCLKTRIPGVSDNIRVRSIVGRYLEHARITRFENGGDPLYYMGSADWMPRNLDKRVEIVFPVLSEENKEKVQHLLDVQLADNLKAHELTEAGTYEKPDLRGKRKIASQITFMQEAAAAAKTVEQGRDPQITRTFVPMEAREPGEQG